MKYINDGSRKELTSFLSIIYKDASSWAGWSCLHLEGIGAARTFSTTEVHEGMTKIVDRHLNGKNGIVFFTGPLDMYLFVKDTLPIILEDACFQIGRYLDEKTSCRVHTYCGMLGEELEADAKIVVSHHDQKSTFLSVAQKTVLLVEDDPITRWMVRSALKNECTLLTAGTAGAALEMYHKCSPDLVFLDINLPDKCGGTVLSEIFQNDPKANIVIFSSLDNVEMMMKMIEYGASGFVSKPFTRKRLLNYVNKCM